MTTALNSNSSSASNAGWTAAYCTGEGSSQSTYVGTQTPQSSPQMAAIRHIEMSDAVSLKDSPNGRRPVPPPPAH